MGVVVKRYIDILTILFPTPLVLAIFFAATSLLCSFFIIMYNAGAWK